MPPKRINRELEKKYSSPSARKGKTLNSEDNSPGKFSAGKRGREERNLGLISLFFILLAAVFLVGKLTIDGRFVRPLNDASPGALPQVVRLEGSGQEENNEAPEEMAFVEPVKTAETEPSPPEPEKPTMREYQSRLFFLKINEEGQILLKSIVRNIIYEEGLLRATLDSLVSGPSQNDLMKGYFTLIPGDTAINNLAIRDGIAWIDVNESFGYNHLGYEGYLAQLKQIVYTSTEFSSVQGVRITINGSEEDFLSAEGISIRDILTRESFQ